jgi:hypothetical protein
MGVGVGKDVEEVGGIWQRGGCRVGWALACGRGVGQWQKRVDKGEGEGIMSGECSGKVKVLEANKSSTLNMCQLNFCT